MKRAFSLAALVLLISGSSVFADALLLAVKSTPYDRQMARIKTVLTTSVTRPSTHVSLTLVNHWMADLRSIPYGFTTIWKTPAEAQSGAPADCKAKAVALYEKMRRNGAINVHLVIGKRTPTSQKTHAWLAWETPKTSYVLDPTFNSRAWTGKQLGKWNYQPYYEYAGTKKYRAATAFLVQN